MVYSWIPQRIKYVTVEDMFEFSQENSTPLLSNFNADFWQTYLANSDEFDAVFKRMFKSYKYFDQKSGEETEEVTERFIEEVYNHLLFNQKRYSELYKIWVLPNDSYSITNSYIFNETQRRAGYHDTDTTHGQRSDSKTTTLGSRSDSSGETIGAISETDTRSMKAFNSSDWQDSDKYDSSTQARSNSATFTKGQEQDTEGYTKGSQSDTEHNTHDETVTINKSGNIGDTSATDVMKKHQDFWNAYNFYKIVFADICKDLLMI